MHHFHVPDKPPALEVIHLLDCLLKHSLHTGESLPAKDSLIYFLELKDTRGEPPPLVVNQDDTFQALWLQFIEGYH